MSASTAARLLLVVTDLELGGTPTVVRELAVRLRDAGYFETEVACLSPWGPVADQLFAQQVVVTALNARSAIDVSPAVSGLHRLLSSRPFDVVLSFLLHANAVSAAVSPLHRGTRFYQSIQTTQPDPAWHWALQGMIAAACRRLIVPSASVRQTAVSRSGIDPGRIDVIPNAVDLQPFDSLFARNRDRPVSTPVKIGFLGRLDPVKRVPLLVEAVGLLPNAELSIFGDGADRATIEAAIDRSSVSGRVRWRGAVASPGVALAEMDVLVLPSLAEGFGLVLIEAMAAGVPVVGTEVPGIRDVIAHGQTGLLAASTPEALASAIRQATDPATRTRLIAAARRTVESKFNWTEVLESYRLVLSR